MTFYLNHCLEKKKFFITSGQPLGVFFEIIWKVLRQIFSYNTSAPSVPKKHLVGNFGGGGEIQSFIFKINAFKRVLKVELRTGAFGFLNKKAI